MSETRSTLDPSIFLQLQEEERQRLAHALMSGPGQVLANALMEVEYALPLLEKNPRVALAGLHALKNELREGLAQLQEYVAELQPPLLEEMGLGPSIHQYVLKFGSRSGIRAECSGWENFQSRYPATIEVALFRILQEALENVQAHAKAGAVHVTLERTATQVKLVIEDNGRGFAPRAHLAGKRRQLGLVAMRDRAELLGGQMQLFSEPGHGVRVVVTIPYHGHPADPIATGGRDSHERTNDQVAGTHGSTARSKTKTNRAQNKPQRKPGRKQNRST